MMDYVLAKRIVCTQCHQIHGADLLYTIEDEVCPSVRALEMRERQLVEEHGDRSKNPEWWAGRTLHISKTRPRPREVSDGGQERDSDNG